MDLENIEMWIFTVNGQSSPHRFKECPLGNKWGIGSIMELNGKKMIITRVLQYENHVYIDITPKE